MFYATYLRIQQSLHEKLYTQDLILGNEFPLVVIVIVNTTSCVAPLVASHSKDASQECILSVQYLMSNALLLLVRIWCQCRLAH